MKISKDLVKLSIKTILDGTKDFELYKTSVSVLKELSNNFKDWWYLSSNEINLSLIKKALEQDFEFKKVIYYKKENRVYMHVQSFIQIIFEKNLIIQVLVYKAYYDARWLYRLYLNETFIRYDLFFDYNFDYEKIEN